MVFGFLALLLACGVNRGEKDHLEAFLRRKEIVFFHTAELAYCRCRKKKKKKKDSRRALAEIAGDFRGGGERGVLSFRHGSRKERSVTVFCGKRPRHHFVFQFQVEEPVAPSKDIVERKRRFFLVVERRRKACGYAGGGSRQSFFALRERGGGSWLCEEEGKDVAIEHERRREKKGSAEFKKGGKQTSVSRHSCRQSVKKRLSKLVVQAPREKEGKGRKGTGHPWRTSIPLSISRSRGKKTERETREITTKKEEKPEKGKMKCAIFYTTEQRRRKQKKKKRKKKKEGGERCAVPLLLGRGKGEGSRRFPSPPRLASAGEKREEPDLFFQHARGGRKKRGGVAVHSQTFRNVDCIPKKEKKRKALSSQYVDRGRRSSSKST